MTGVTLLDEKALRTETFRDDLAVVLADGQTWHLRKPTVRFTAKKDGAGKATLCRKHYLDGSTHDPAYDELAESYQAARKAADVEDQTEEEVGAAADALLLVDLQMAVALLRSNYRLTLEEAGDLLAIDLGDSNSIIQLYRISILGTGRIPPPPIEPGPATADRLPEVASVDISPA